MNAPATSVGGAAPVRGRRRLFALQGAVVAFALTVCCVLAVVVAARFPARFDATALGRHRLSPQTQSVLAALPDPVRLVVALRVRDLEPRAAQGLQDVLGAFESGSGKVRVDLFDLGEARGMQRYEALIQSLVDEDRAALDAHAGALRDLSGTAAQLSEQITLLADGLVGVRDALLAAPPPGSTKEALRSSFDNQGGLMRVLADDLAKVAGQARGVLDRTQGAAAALGGDDHFPVPRSDLAGDALRPMLSRAATTLSELQGALDQAAGPSVGASPDARERAKALTLRVTPARDAAARAVLALEQLPRLRVFSVAKAMKASEVALLIGPQQKVGGPESPSGGATGAPPSVAAISLSELLAVRSTGDAQGAGGVDLRYRAEDLIAAGLSAFTPDAKPLVVFVHAGERPLAPAYNGFRAVTERLNLRGMGIADWPAALSNSEPKEVGDARAAGRPVVYVNVSPDVRDPAGAVRMNQLAKALEALSARGAPMLVSVNPSTLPASGAPDPLVSWLAPLGISPDSGRAIATEVTTAAGQRVTAWDEYLTEPGTRHPLGESLRGLPLRLVWPVALDLPASGAGGGPGAHVQPILVLPPGATRWGESEWQAFRSASRNPPPPPRPDSSRDRLAPVGGGAWVVAASINTPASGAAPAQRLVVVGSNGWFLDVIVDRATEVDGRLVLDCPGNLELFENAVWWLAGREDRVLRSAAAEAVPLIPALSPGRLSALQWGVIALLPLVALVTGAIWLTLRR